MSHTSPQINHYANSMFRFEAFNEKWLDSCANYIRFLFGNSVEGKTVVDYAFGRGNWALAFLRAGAKEVIAIDASIDNVMRFRTYCEENQIRNVNIIHGNILEGALSLKCDLLWLYGILHHIKEFDVFLSGVKKWMKSKDSPIYIYYYNKNSLREKIVEICRGLHTYKDENEFIEDNYLFLRNAKGRASDDLVAPYVGWKTAVELQRSLNGSGLYVHRQDIDFQEYISGIGSVEFYPHQFLCTLNSMGEIQVTEREQKNSTEVSLISNLFDEILITYPGEKERKNISIGLFNTHFTYLRDASRIDEPLIEIFLYLMRLLLQAKVLRNANFSSLAEGYYKLLTRSMADAIRVDEAKAIGQNLFTEYLEKNRIRL